MQNYDLEVMIGFSCNNNCIFCSNRSLRQECHRKGIAAISLEKTKKILASHDSSKVDNLFLLGGEPTILKNLLNILAMARGQGYRNITLVTNGRMLSNLEFARRLICLDVNLVLSIHGPAEIHDHLTQVKGSFEQMHQGMKNLYMEGKRFATNTVINRQNHDRLREIVDVVDPFKPEHMLFSLVSCVGLSKYEREMVIPSLELLHDDLSCISDKGYVRVQDVPYCIMRDLEHLMHEKEQTMERKVVIAGMKDFMYNENKSVNEKEKSLQCRSCKRNDECQGIWKEYLEHQEIRPILR